MLTPDSDDAHVASIASVTSVTSVTSVALRAIDATPQERKAFLARTYAHLGGAIYATVLLDTFYFISGIAQTITGVLASNWTLTIIAFLAVAFAADYWARRATSPFAAVGGLALFVVAESIMVLPIFYAATYWSSPAIIQTAVFATLTVFGGLTVYVFMAPETFDAMSHTLAVGTIGGLALVLGVQVVGFSTGLLTSVLVVMVASAYVLYVTSEVMREYRIDQYDAAALALYASITLMLWAMVRLLVRK